MRKYRGILAVMSAVILVSCIGTSIAAAAFDVSEIEYVTLYTGEEVEDGETIVMPRAGFSISSSSLAAGRKAKSSSTYYIEENMDSLEYTVNWTPTGQSIKIGFYNEETGQLYLSNEKTGGSASGTIITYGVPDGEYYVIVYACEDNTKSISVNATCEWDQ